MKNRRKIKILCLFSAILLYSIDFFCQSPAQISIPFLVYDNAGGQQTLYFGLDQTATDSIDTDLGESDLPPFPPTGVFDARWFLPPSDFNGSLGSWKDYRFAPAFPFTGMIEHRFRYQSTADATTMYFSWDFPPEVTGLLQDAIDGTIVNVPISGTGVYELTNFSVLDEMKLTISYNNIITGIEDNRIKSNTFLLEQNYPNPFNPNTTIEFSLPETVKNIKLTIYNTLGQNIAELVNAPLQAGNYKYEWNAKNSASGIYICELRTEKFVSSKKMLLLK